MLPEERVIVARLSYLRALAAARRRSSRASWRRLLTAARNLAWARQDREKRTRPATGRPEAGRPPAATEPRPARVIPLLPRAARAHAHEVWTELSREWERSQALIARSRALVESAQRLRTRET